MPQYAEARLVGPLSDDLAFDFTALALGTGRIVSPWTRPTLPCFSVYLDMDAAAPVVLYQAPAALAAPEDRIPLVAATLQHAERHCRPLWVSPAGAPYQLRITSTAASVVLRVTWSLSGGF